MLAQDQAHNLYRVQFRYQGLLSWRDSFFGTSFEDARANMNDELQRDPGVAEIELLVSHPELEWKTVYAVSRHY